MSLSNVKSRYVQSSDVAEVSNPKELVALIRSNLAAEAGDLYGTVCRSTDSIEPSLAKDCVEAIDSLPAGQDLANYVFLSRQDLMARSSFTWDLREGKIPETGSRQTVAHSPIPLAPGRQYFEQFVHKGECCPLIGSGWASFYYSEHRCREVFQAVRQLVGKSWSVNIKRKYGYQGVPQSLVAIFRSHKASEVCFSLTLVGQGKIRWIPDLLVEIEQGKVFFNVLDTDNNRVRMGWDGRDELWQYP